MLKFKDTFHANTEVAVQLFALLAITSNPMKEAGVALYERKEDVGHDVYIYEYTDINCRRKSVLFIVKHDMVISEDSPVSTRDFVELTSSEVETLSCNYKNDRVRISRTMALLAKAGIK